MKYKRKTDEAIDKIRSLNPHAEYEKIMNRLSTGGPIERSFKKRIGNKTHKTLNKEDMVSKYYDAIEKAYKNIHKDRE